MATRELSYHIWNPQVDKVCHLIRWQFDFDFFEFAFYFIT
jgi:hypothetical protein